LSYAGNNTRILSLNLKKIKRVFRLIRKFSSDRFFFEFICRNRTGNEEEIREVSATIDDRSFHRSRWLQELSLPKHAKGFEEGQSMLFL